MVTCFIPLVTAVFNSPLLLAFVQPSTVLALLPNSTMETMRFAVVL